MKQIYEKLLGSLDNEKNKGFSGRKLTAFALVAMVIVILIKWVALGDFSQLIPVLTTLFLFISALFGMTTYQSMKEQPKTTTSTLEQQVTGDISKTTLTEESKNEQIP
ncbi:MAG TPA: hypothetical protein VGC65_00145 [Bacteroidia bacterium]|jgi:cobalamin synthase